MKKSEPTSRKKTGAAPKIEGPIFLSGLAFYQQPTVTRSPKPRQSESDGRSSIASRLVQR
jgi:hypothetical protein